MGAGVAAARLPPPAAIAAFVCLGIVAAIASNNAARVPSYYPPQPIPAPVPRDSNVAPSLTTGQIDQAITAAQGALAQAVGGAVGSITYLYRGTALKRAGQPGDPLWTSTSISYTTAYAHFDARANRDSPAISIYAIPTTTLTQLVASKQVRQRFNNLEYGFTAPAQPYLIGPIVVQIDFQYKGP